MRRRESETVAAAAGPRGRALPPVQAYVALVLGASAMGASPIFVRLAEVGPFASAFWRMALAIPFLWVWLLLEQARRPADASAAAVLPRFPGTVVLIGFLFAGDLFFWHLAILNTSIANATLLATMAPIVVALGASAVLGERVTGPILLGVVLGITGAALIVGRSAGLEPGNLIGDLYGVITCLFFGAYLLAVSRARRHLSPAAVMFYPAVVASLLLLVAALALDDGLLPATWRGAVMLLGLALVSQVGGQGLAAYALGHLPAVFSSLVIFCEAIAAALFAALLFAEAISLWQVAGGVLILAGIYSARPRRAG